MLYPRANGVQRLSIRRADGREGVTWDELMAVKAEIGLAERWAVEVYPPDADVVNVANMRHLWLLDGRPIYAWRGP